MELRPGRQHCQKDTPAFLRRMLADAGAVTDQPVLLRLDGGNDSIENVEVVLGHNEGRTRARASAWRCTAPGRPVTGCGYDYSIRRVMRVTERTIDRRGQHLLHPAITIEGCWTSLSDAESTVINLYSDHGTSEQFRSEFKTDLDIERLPSGRFAANALVVQTSVLA